MKVRSIGNRFLLVNEYTTLDKFHNKIIMESKFQVYSSKFYIHILQFNLLVKIFNSRHLFYKIYMRSVNINFTFLILGSICRNFDLIEKSWKNVENRLITH